MRNDRIEGNGRGTYVALETSDGTGIGDRPTRRAAQGDGAAIVLRERESRLPGEGRQVSGNPIGEVREMRNAETILGIKKTLESRVLRKAYARFGGGRREKYPQGQLARRLPYFLVTANSRQVLAEVVLPRITAFLAERGVRLSTEKTVITPLAEGFDFLGQTLRKHDGRNGQPAKLLITPSTASFQALTA